MQTKLVYVLTCAPEATYIEQALISIWSARYHNPDAHIVLLVDDLTNQLLVGKRAEVLEYVTEKVVVELPIEMSMVIRSRWLKTSMHKYVKGDLLFIDTDTIITRPLYDIEQFPYPIGAVLDYQVTLKKYPKYLYEYVKNKMDSLHIDLSKEDKYFNSGVLYAKDLPITEQLREKWFIYFREGLKSPFIGDQPYLCKSNVELGHVIEELPGIWNCIMYTYPKFDRDAYILHFSALDNMCFLFDKHCLHIIREQGLKNFKSIILTPQVTYIAHIQSRLFSSYRNISKALCFIDENCPNSLDTYLIKFRRKDNVRRLMYKKYYSLAAGYICIYLLLQQWRRQLMKILRS